MKSLIVVVVFLAVSLNLYAQIEIPYVDAQKSFSKMDQRFTVDLKLLETASEMKIEQIQKTIDQLRIELNSCTDYACAVEKKSQIAKKEQEIKTETVTAQKEQTEIKINFVRSGLAALIDSLSYELKLLTKQVGLNNLKLHSDTPCLAKRSEALGAVYPSKRMICRQLNLEFKRGAKFIDVSLAIGFAQNAFDHNGETFRFDEFELTNVRTLFTYSLSKHLDGLNPLYIFGRDPNYSTGRSPESDYVSVPVGNYGHDLKWFYHIRSYDQLGYYFVKWNEI